MRAVYQRGGFVFYLVARIVVGLLFAMHGAQKLFGWFGVDSVSLVSKFGLAGIIELVCGLAIAVGFFVTPALLLSAVLMVAAFVTAHLPKGWNPLVNGGELALLFFAAFMALLSFQSKRAEFNFDSLRNLFRK